MDLAITMIIIFAINESDHYIFTYLNIQLMKDMYQYYTEHSDRYEDKLLLNVIRK